MGAWRYAVLLIRSFLTFFLTDCHPISGTIKKIHLVLLLFFRTGGNRFFWGPDPPLKGLSHEIDFKNFDKNLQNLT